MAIISCADQGCIEADDFGEYESETIEVSASNSQDQCNYDSTKALDDSGNQGSGVITCFATGSSTVVDENGISYSSASKGCIGFEEQQEPIARELCISNCIQKCNINLSSGGSQAEPNWTSTNKRASNMNYGVTIRPGSKIYIRAIGDIYLGDQASYPNIYVKADEYRPDSFDIDWEKIFFDVRNQQSLNLKFSGLWDNNANSSDGVLGGGANKISSSGSETSDINLYNGVRRFIAYLIPHQDGYSFDSSADSEESGSINLPLLADSRAWKCTYTGNILTQTSCKSDREGYTNNGYTKVDNELANETFPISSEVLKAGVGQYGGMIRWDVDGIGEIDNNYNPFSAITLCSTSECNVSNIPANQGRILGDLSTAVTIFNPSSEESYQVSFKSIETTGSCVIDLANQTPDISVYVIDKNNNPVHEYEKADNSGPNLKSLNISKDSWSSEPISIEPEQKIIVSSAGLNAECGKIIAVRFLKYHDIKISNSGFVSFATLDALSGNCQINARIVNPEGSHSRAMFSGDYNASSTYEADFYEYENFSQNSADPLRNLKVYPRSTGNIGWTNPVFLRKGQIIRFAPESWNGKFTTNAGDRKCGIGMAMRIDPRPALLCRGKTIASSPEYINNPQCNFDYAIESSGNIKVGDLLGCSENAQLCDDTNSNLYCPINCRKEIINCVNADINNQKYAKTNCTINSSYNDSCDTNSADVLNGNCGRCDNKRLSNALTATKIEITGLDKCYDLENYKGRVKSINQATGFSSEELSNSKISKGATLIPFFNGSYGNFNNFYDTENTEGNGDINEVFAVKDPLIFSQSGRLKFLMLDGDDFKGSQGARLSYNDNSISVTKYNYQNGFKLTLSGLLNFSNGQWLQARLCKESSGGSVDCKSTNVSKLISNPAQPDLVEIDLANSTAISPKITSPYKFDDYGNLVRIKDRENIDCSLEFNGVEVNYGDFFYCHTYQFYNKDAFEQLSDSDKERITNDVENLRLSFKIIDPETNNCLLTTGQPTNSNTATGIIIKNSYYDSSDANNNGKYCNPESGQTPGYEANQCQYEFLCANKYSNNKGKYYVNIKVKNEDSGGISNIIGSVINPVINIMDGTKINCKLASTSSSFDGSKTNNPDFDRTSATTRGQTCFKDEALCTKEFKCDEPTIGQAERIYKLLISDYRYKSLLTLCLVVMITFYGLGYLMGVSEFSNAEIVSRIIKIGLIYLFVGEVGWEWFNSIVVSFFKEGSDYLAFLMASSFDDSAEIQNAINNNDFYDKSVLFSSVDRVFGMFFSDAVLKKISALLFASIFGWAYLLIIIFSFILYVLAVANAVLLYLTAQVFMSILFTLGPIFFIFTLFGPTKEMFDNWLKSLIGFSLQQILLLITLAFFNMLMYEVIKMSLGYKICWDEVWTINIIARISLLSFWTIASLPPRTNPQSEIGNIGNPDGIPSLFSILFIWVIASLMNKFIGFMVGLASDISGGISASKLASGAVATGNQIKGIAEKKASEVWKKSGAEEMIQRADMTLFDSGALAEKEREKNKLQNIKDKKEKTQLAKGGKSAVEQFKKDNQAKLNSMSKPEQQALLDKVKAKGEIETGKKLGMSDDRIKELRDMKGFGKHSDKSDILGMVASKSRQAVGGAISGDGTIMKSMSQQKADISHKKEDIKAGLKNMTAEQRDEFKKNSNLDIKKSSIDQAMEFSARSTINAASNAAGSLKNEASERSSAISQLEKEGEIKRMTPGTNFLRDREEKEKISKRIEENKKQKSVSSKKQNARGQHGVEKEVDRKNLEEEVNNINSDPNLTSTQKTTKIAEAKKNRQTANSNAIREKVENKYQEDLKNETNETNEYLDNLAGKRTFDEGTGKFKKEAHSVNGKIVSSREGGQISKLKEELSTVNEEREKYLQSDEGKEYSKKIEKLGQIISNPKSTGSQKKSAVEQLEATTSSNEKLKEFSKKEDKISASIHNTQRQIDNFNAKLNNLGYNEEEDEKEIAKGPVTKVSNLDVASGEKNAKKAKKPNNSQDSTQNPEANKNIQALENGDSGESEELNQNKKPTPSEIRQSLDSDARKARNRGLSRRKPTKVSGNNGNPDNQGSPKDLEESDTDSVDSDSESDTDSVESDSESRDSERSPTTKELKKETLKALNRRLRQKKQTTDSTN